MPIQSPPTARWRRCGSARADRAPRPNMPGSCAGWLESRREAVDPFAEGQPRRRLYRLTGEGAAASRQLDKKARPPRSVLPPSDRAAKRTAELPTHQAPPCTAELRLRVAAILEGVAGDQGTDLPLERLALLHGTVPGAKPLPPDGACDLPRHCDVLALQRKPLRDQRRVLSRWLNLGDRVDQRFVSTQPAEQDARRPLVVPGLQRGHVVSCQVGDLLLSLLADRVDLGDVLRAGGRGGGRRRAKAP